MPAKASFNSFSEICPNAWPAERTAPDQSPAATKLNARNRGQESLDIHLDKEGFELHDFDPSFKEFADEAKVKQVFYQQVVDFVKAHTGAKRVEVFVHTIRQ
jgi:hypothetical protein